MQPQVINTFHTHLQPSTQRDSGFRLFRVDDIKGIDIPGCLAIHELRLDNVPIPEYVDEKVLSDYSGKNHHTVRVNMYQIVQGDNGPLLLRSMKCNDGVWQEGSVVAIRGEWEDEGDGLDEMSAGDLKNKCSQLGITFPKGFVKKIDMIYAIRMNERGE